MDIGKKYPNNCEQASDEILQILKKKGLAGNNTFEMKLAGRKWHHTWVNFEDQIIDATASQYIDKIGRKKLIENGLIDSINNGIWSKENHKKFIDLLFEWDKIK